MKRVLLGIAVAATVALGTSPASAEETGVQICGFTPPVPCGVCVNENPVSQCVWI